MFHPQGVYRGRSCPGYQVLVQPRRDSGPGWQHLPAILDCPLRSGEQRPSVGGVAPSFVGLQHNWAVPSYNEVTSAHFWNPGRSPPCHPSALCYDAPPLPLCPSEHLLLLLFSHVACLLPPSLSWSLRQPRSPACQSDAWCRELRNRHLPDVGSEPPFLLPPAAGREWLLKNSKEK